MTGKIVLDQESYDILIKESYKRGRREALKQALDMARSVEDGDGRHHGLVSNGIIYMMSSS